MLDKVTLSRATHPSAESQGIQERDCPKRGLLSHLPLFPPEKQHSSDLIFFVGKEGKREERMEG